MPTYTQIVYEGAMALLMGLLVGLERQHSQKDEPLFAGFRTFPLITLMGYLAALGAKAGWGWMLPVAFAGVCGVAVASYVITAQGPHKGATTEFMAMLAFLFGALTAFGYLVPAATFAVATTLLLSVKAPLHRLAQTLQEDEMYAILKFGVVTVIILPLLPDRTFGPLEVLNPRLIWWMVVLISAVSMLGYVLMRALGARQGIAVTGILGGLASSTAVALGLSAKAKTAEPSLARYFGLGIMIASTIMFLRVLVLTFVIDAQLGVKLAVPLLLPLLVGIGCGFYLWRKRSTQGDPKLEVKNPMELGRALQFALVFAVVLFISRAAHHFFGATGVYVAGGLAGLTDVDAFTVSAARLAHDNVLSSTTANASILLACGANTLVKGGIAATMGGAALRAVVIPVFSAVFVASVVACLLAAQA